MLNKYQWENYISAGGKEIVSIFQDFLDFKDLEKFPNTINMLVNNFCPDKSQGEELKKGLRDLLIKPLIQNKSGPILEITKEYTVKSALNFVYREYRELIKNEKRKVSDSNILLEFLCNMDWLTTQISLEIPELFIPYYFQRNFNIFSSIVDMFHIKLDLNKIPTKSDYKGRFYYYGEICKACHDFRIENNLTVAELWAFLYDYAPKCVGGLDYIKEEFPEPKNAFFICGASNNMFRNSPILKEYPKITFWQCNPHARAGDVMVFYMTYPDSRIDSIWTSIIDAFIDPFFWYYKCTYIANARKVPDNLFKIKSIKKDPVLGKLPIVRCNMQVIDGIEVPPEAYNYIVEKSNLSDKFKIKYNTFRANTKTGAISLKINNEHDVERKVLEPLLEKLGWDKQDYETQKRVKMGRNMRLIPDYLLLPDFKHKYHEKCYFIWEVKESIPNDEELNEAKGQVISYARRLCSKKCGIIAKQGIWIMSQDDDYTKEIFQSSFKGLKRTNVFKKLIDIAGKK